MTNSDKCVCRLESVQEYAAESQELARQFSTRPLDVSERESRVMILNSIIYFKEDVHDFPFDWYKSVNKRICAKVFRSVLDNFNEARKLLITTPYSFPASNESRTFLFSRFLVSVLEHPDQPYSILSEFKSQLETKQLVMVSKYVDLEFCCKIQLLSGILSSSNEGREIYPRIPGHPFLQRRY